MTAPERIRACGDLHPQWGVQFKCYPMPLQPMPEFGLTEYVRADLHDATERKLAKVVEALKFYQDAWSYKINKRYGGLEWNPTEALLDDCGNTAKTVLAEIEKGGM